MIAGALFVLPGAIVILALAFGYIAYGELPLVQKAFLGIKAAVIVIVLQALLKIAKKALHGPTAWTIAALSFAAIFALRLPFPLIVILAALWGFWTTTATAPGTTTQLPALRATLRTVMIWSALWVAPMLACLLLGQDFLLHL